MAAAVSRDMSLPRTLVITGAVLHILAASAPAESGLLRRSGKQSRRKNKGYDVRASVPASADRYPHAFLKQVTLSHDGMRLYSYGAVEHRGTTWAGQRWTSVVPHVGNNRTVSDRDARRLRREARRQLAQELRALEMIEKGGAFADEGASLLRSSRALLVSQPLKVHGIREHEQSGHVTHYDPLGRFLDDRRPNDDTSEAMARTFVVTFQRVPGTKDLRPVKLGVTGGRLPEEIDLAARERVRYFGD